MEQPWQFGINRMLLYQQPQKEGLHAMDVGPVDASKPYIQANEEAAQNSVNQCLQWSITITNRDE